MVEVPHHRWFCSRGMPASPLGTVRNLCYSMSKAVVFVKELLKRGLVIIVAVVACLVMLLSVPINFSVYSRSALDSLDGQGY